MGSKVTKTRDRHGLLPQQRLVLQELLTSRSWADAEAAHGVTPRTIGRWMRSDPRFRAAYEKLFDDRGETIRKEVAASAAKAADTLEAALDATSSEKLDVTCPNCHVEFEVDLRKPNWSARLRAAESVLKIGGQLKDVKKIEGEIVHMSIEHKIALVRLARGLSVPPGIMEDLRKMNLLEAPSDDNTIDAEWEDVTDGRAGTKDVPSTDGRG